MCTARRRTPFRRTRRLSYTRRRRCSPGCWPQIRSLRSAHTSPWCTGSRRRRAPQSRHTRHFCRRLHWCISSCRRSSDRRLLPDGCRSRRLRSDHPCIPVRRYTRRPRPRTQCRCTRRLSCTLCRRRSPPHWARTNSRSPGRIGRRYTGFRRCTPARPPGTGPKCIHRQSCTRSRRRKRRPRWSATPRRSRPPHTGRRCTATRRRTHKPDPRTPFRCRCPREYRPRCRRSSRCWARTGSRLPHRSCRRCTGSRRCTAPRIRHRPPPRTHRRWCTPSRRCTPRLQTWPGTRTCRRHCTHRWCTRWNRRTHTPTRRRPRPGTHRRSCTRRRRRTARCWQ